MSRGPRLRAAGPSCIRKEGAACKTKLASSAQARAPLDRITARIRSPIAHAAAGWQALSRLGSYHAHSLGLIWSADQGTAAELTSCS